ncbi:glycosyltransferase family 4 protein [Alcanivorax jadensis]|uniref:glycosyltransferase family 4 protein n=1 Tax=Alcanivorax jadensis TaxID=64988 RepID=UPI002409F805|nr:glycosyltransferase family 4 protein [Alcanivorax jadensis]MDF1637582.1 glycosyltransferase family 4 protein [Alcanivorax jadensis]
MSIDKQRLIFLLESWRPPGAPGSTGGTLYNYYLVSALSEVADVTVFTLDAPDTRVPAGAELHLFSEKASFLPGSRFLFWKQDLLACLPEDGNDIILVTSTSTNAILDVAIRRGFSTVSIVQAYEDFGFKVPDGSPIKRLNSLKRLLVTGQFFYPKIRNAGHVIVNSEYMLGALTKNLGVGSNPFLLYPPLSIDINVGQIFTPDARNSIGFVNREGKNFDFVVSLAERIPEYDFLIFGHPVSDDVEVPRNVKIVGWVSDKIKMFRQAYTWIMPSLWMEPFGLVVIEAMSQGCRVGVSARGGLPEAIGNHGKVFNGFDIDEWGGWLRDGYSQNNLDEVELRDHLHQFSLENFSATAKEYFLKIATELSMKVST